jgi:hypothetical protein
MIHSFNAVNTPEGQVQVTFQERLKGQVQTFTISPAMAQLLATQLNDAARRCTWKRRKGNKNYGVEE